MLQVTAYYKYLMSETATAIGSRKNMIQYKGEINTFFRILVNIFNPTASIIQTFNLQYNSVAQFLYDRSTGVVGVDYIICSTNLTNTFVLPCPRLLLIKVTLEKANICKNLFQRYDLCKIKIDNSIFWDDIWILF